jgi:hypothetical protein
MTMPDDAAEPRRITIEIVESNDFTVREADRYCDKLIWDEMLGTIAELTHPRLGTCAYRMLTEEEWRRDRERLTITAKEEV